MIYIKIDSTTNEVNFQHFMPFDEVNGLHKTEEELLQEGYLVDSIPEPEQINGKVAKLKYDGSNLYYEYVDAPLTPEQEIEALKAQNAQMLFALVQGGLL